ncbi:hypothetical protein ADEAN_000266700 [Angomonas deanei]|uniref:Uncharacterized protein n=1 Tax=Angomonas deanei TaxID=59799 RepID=A0A7G2CB04_9TRYP|nr:hypothetical protein ADEAN_000266700 [Angomonas deanei]
MSNLLHDTLDDNASLYAGGPSDHGSIDSLLMLAPTSNMDLLALTEEPALGKKAGVTQKTNHNNNISRSISPQPPADAKKANQLTSPPTAPSPSAVTKNNNNHENNNNNNEEAYYDDVFSNSSMDFGRNDSFSDAANSVEDEAENAGKQWYRKFIRTIKWVNSPEGIDLDIDDPDFVQNNGTENNNEEGEEAGGRGENFMAAITQRNETPMHPNQNYVENENENSVQQLPGDYAVGEDISSSSLQEEDENNNNNQNQNNNNNMGYNEYQNQNNQNYAPQQEYYNNNNNCNVDYQQQMNANIMQQQMLMMQQMRMNGRIW